MKRRSPQLFFLTMLAALLSLAASHAAAERTSADEWVSVRSQNFLVEGRAREKELRRMAVRLEEYRAAFSRLLSGEHFDANVPTTIVVFPDDSAFKPFKPLLGGQAAGVAGYFQPGAEVNYITLALDSDSARDPSTLLHEYTHLLVNNYFSGTPLWLKEGLSEFYSTARISADRRRMTLGEPPTSHSRALLGRELLPFSTLFVVDHASPQYVEQGQRGLFYAESWALVHYLSEVRGGEHGDRVARFIALLADGATVEDSFRQAFGAGISEIEAGFSSYVRLGRYNTSTEEFARPLDFDSQLQARTLSPAEVSARLGDLLLHTDRDEDAERYLLRAVELDPRLSSARVSLGALLLRQGRLAESHEQLRAAISIDPQNHLAHYYLADALNREGASASSDKTSVSEFEERTEAIRAELRRAIELSPGFVEPYRLLAVIELERGDRPEEAVVLLRRATTLAPRRLDITFMLAQAQLFGGQFEEARRLAESIAQHAADEHLRAQAASLITRIDARQQQSARLRAQADEAAKLEAGLDAAAPVQPCDMPVQGGPYYKKLRFEGTQACGRLAEIECADGGVMLRIETRAGTLRLRAEDLRGIRFVTYTASVKTGRISCGMREPADSVLVTYRARPDKKQVFDGEALAVEFVPEDWNHSDSP